jgi:ribosome-binding factor A
MQHKRSDKVAETIHELISSILSKGLNDPRIGFVTITAVEVTDDLHPGTGVFHGYRRRPGQKG